MRISQLSGATQRLALACAVSVLVSCDSGTDPGPQPASISVNPNPLALVQLGTQQLVPVVYDGDGALISGVAVSFSSDNESVVTVTKGGLVASVGPAGTASITLRAGAATEPLPVTVVAVNSAIAVTPDPITLPQKTALTVDAKVTDAVGAPVPGAILTYTTTDPSLFTVSSTGVITSVGPAGVSNLIIEHDTLQRIVPVAVTQVPTGIEVSPTEIVLPVGGQLQMSARVVDAIGVPVVGAAISYVSSNTNRVTVSNDGLVQVVGGLGTAVITLSSGSLSRDLDVQVVDVGHPVGSDVNAVSVSGQPWGIAVSSGNVVYITTPGDGSLQQSALTSPAFSVVESGYSIPLSIAFSSSGSVAFLSIDNGIKVIDVASASEVAGNAFHTGGGVFAVALSPDEQTLAIGTSGSLHLMDVGTLTVTDNFTTPGAVNSIVFSPDGTRLYASQFTSDIVGEYNVSTKAHIRDITASGTPQGIGISANGGTLYVAKEGSANGLEIIDLATDSRTQVNTGATCFGLAMSLDQSEVWLACSGAVVAVDRSSRTVRTSAVTGGYHRRIAFAPDGFTAVVTSDDGNVYFIR